VRIEARRVGADDRQQDAATARGVRRLGCGDRQRDHDSESDDDEEQRAGMPGACGHP
jgi:hypothetical protein